MYILGKVWLGDVGTSGGWKGSALTEQSDGMSKNRTACGAYIYPHPLIQAIRNARTPLFDSWFWSDTTALSKECHNDAKYDMIQQPQTLQRNGYLLYNTSHAHCASMVFIASGVNTASPPCST